MRSRLTRLGYAISAAAFGVVLAPFFLLPSDLTRRAFGALGRALLPLAPAARRIRENLAHVGPRPGWPPPAAIAAEIVADLGRALAEYVRMPEVAAEAARRRTDGIGHLRAGLARGRGAIVASAHLGNWEAIRLAARDAGIEVGIIYRAFDNPWFDAMARWRIRRAGEPVLHKGGAGMRAMLGHLRAGGAILVLVDQRLTRGEALRFLGRPALTATAIAATARKTGAALIPARALRDASGLGFDVAFEPEVATGDDAATMRALNARIEAWVEAAPGQWFWLHRRWRGRRGRAFLGESAAG